LPQLHESANYIHGYLRRSRTIENGGRHDGAMLGEGERQVLSVAAVTKS